jgi:hypothetical protein
MIFQPQARDTYTVRVTTSCDARLPIAGNVFATRAEAEAYAAPFVQAGRFTVTGTCPSYDRTARCPRCNGAGVVPFGERWGLSGRTAPCAECNPAALVNIPAYTGRPYRQGDPIEGDPDRESLTIF